MILWHAGYNFRNTVGLVRLGLSDWSYVPKLRNNKDDDSEHDSTTGCRNSVQPDGKGFACASEQCLADLLGESFRNSRCTGQAVLGSLYRRRRQVGGNRVRHLVAVNDCADATQYCDAQRKGEFTAGLQHGGR